MTPGRQVKLQVTVSSLNSQQSNSPTIPRQRKRNGFQAATLAPGGADGESPVTKRIRKIAGPQFQLTKKSGDNNNINNLQSPQHNVNINKQGAAVVVVSLNQTPTTKASEMSQQPGKNYPTPPPSPLKTT